MGNPSPFDVPLNGEFVPGEKPLYRKLPNVDETAKELHKQPVMPTQKVVNKKFYSFLRLFFFASIVCILIGGFMFLNLVKDGKFQSTNNQEVTLEPNTYINASFNSSTSNENDYNFTIVNEINCPDVVCNCGDSE